MAEEIDEGKEFGNLLLKSVQELSKKNRGDGSEVCRRENRQREIPREFQNGEGSDTFHHLLEHNTAHQVVPRTPPCSTMPTFLTSGAGAGGPHEPKVAQYGEYLIEYRPYGPEFRDALTFNEFCQLKNNNRPCGQNRGGGYMQGNDLQGTVGRLFLPTFDGSLNCLAKAWLEKLDIYFQLNQMAEVEAIKVAALHLEGEAHDW